MSKVAEGNIVSDARGIKVLESNNLKVFDGERPGEKVVVIAAVVECEGNGSIKSGSLVTQFALYVNENALQSMADQAGINQMCM